MSMYWTKQARGMLVTCPAMMLVLFLTAASVWPARCDERRPAPARTDRIERMERIGPGTVLVQSKTTLKATQTTGDFIRWVDVVGITQPWPVTFLSTTTEPGVKAFRYEVATSPWPGPLSEMKLPAILDSGPLPVATDGSAGRFQIDFKKFAPATPPKGAAAITYYVRVVPLDAANNPIGFASPAVRVIYQEALPRPAVLDLSGLQTSPMPVVISLDNFKCLNADEDNFYSNGDEPYLYVVAIYADGTTINAGNLKAAQVRIQSPTQTHDNLGLDHVKAGSKSYPIPTSTGRFETSILPLAGDLPLNLARDLSQVAIVVIALDEDGTSTSAANAGRKALVDNLQKELDTAIQSMSVPDINTIQQKVTDEVVNAIKEETLRNWWNPSGWFGVVDPDDFIGAQFARFSYTQLMNAGTAGTPINMEFKKSGVHYTISGVIRQK